MIVPFEDALTYKFKDVESFPLTGGGIYREGE